MFIRDLYVSYWSTIEYTTEDGRADKLWTCNPFQTMEDAINWIRFCGEQRYQITKAYVDVYWKHICVNDEQKHRKFIDLEKHGIVIAPPEPPMKRVFTDLSWLHP